MVSHLLAAVPASCSTGRVDSGRRSGLKPLYTTHARDSIKAQFAQQLLQSLCVSARSGVIWWFAEGIQRCTIVLVADSCIKNNCGTALCGVTFLQIAFMLTWACTWLAFNMFNCTVPSPQCAAAWECVVFFSFKTAAEVLESSWNSTFQLLPPLLPPLSCLN